MESVGFEDSAAKRLLLLIQSGADRTGHFLGIERTTHHQRIWMQREHKDSEHTTRENGRKRQLLKRRHKQHETDLLA